MTQHNDVSAMQAALKKVYGREFTEQEAWEAEKVVVDLITLLEENLGDIDIDSPEVKA